MNSDSNITQTTATAASLLAQECNCEVSMVVTLDEDGLPNGIAGGPQDAPGQVVSGSGTLDYDFGANGPADSGAFRWDPSGLPELTSGGEVLTYQVSPSGQTLTARTPDGTPILHLKLTDLDSGSFKIALLGPLDHPQEGTEDNLVFSVGYIVKDADGDEAHARLGLDIDDDTPTNSIDTPSVVEQGDTVTGTWSQNGGADGIADTTVKLPGDDTDYSLGSPIDTGNGTLTVNPDGTWSFTADPDAEGSLDFQIVTTDGDGDSITCDGHIDITEGGDSIPTTPETDGNPNTNPAKAIVDEDGLPGGIAGGVNDVAGENVAATGSLGYNFGDDGQGSFSWNTDNLPSLTSNGSPVTWTLSGNGRSLVGVDGSGDRVISVQLTDVANGTYKVVLAKPLDHSNPEVEDDINFDVSYTITDSDGDSASGVLKVTVDDDMPVVSDDTATTDSNTPVTVDVLDDIDFGADGPGTVTDATVEGGPDVGTVTINPDGSLTFVPDPDFSGNANIDYTVTDGDGDAVEGQVTVTVDEGDEDDNPTTPETDDDPDTNPAKAILDEDGLPGGIAGGINDVAGEPIAANGSLGYDFGDDGQGSFTWNTDDLPSLTSNGSPVTWTLNPNGRNLQGFDDNGDRVIAIQLTDVANGSYKVVLEKPLDHSNPDVEDDINFDVGYTITDSDGDAASGVLKVTVDDDTPVANDDTATTDSNTPVTVDVLGNDDNGADGPGTITDATVNGGPDVGTVTINPDGTLTFVPAPDFSGNANIDYTVTDGDGDTTDGQLTVTVDEGDEDDTPTTPETDDDPNTNPAKAILDEDGLPDGIAGGVNDVAGEPIAASGSLGYDFGDDGQGSFTWNTDTLPSLTSNGSPVTWSLSGNGRSLVGFDGNGDRVISVQLTDVANGTYKVVLAKPLDHSNPEVEDDINFDVSYTITDSDGDAASGVLKVTVDDDTPVANDDTVNTDNDTPVTVDVLGNDDNGADGPGTITDATVDGGPDVGTVTINPDGTLTFVPDPDFSGNAVIDYTGTDGDGDTTEGQLTVNVGEGDDQPTTPETDGDPDTNPAKVVLDEDGLPSGNAGGPGDVAGERTVVTGTLGYDFGDDGPAANGGFSWNSNTTSLPATTADGQDVRYFLSSSGLSLVGLDEDGNRVLVIDMLDTSTGEFKVTLSKPLQHNVDGVEDDLNFNVGYTVTDSDGDTADGQANIVIDDDTPVAKPDTATTSSDSSVTIDVLDNDSLGADGGDITAANVMGGSDTGEVTINPDGTITFTPNPEFSGDAVIEYQVTDQDGDSITNNATISVSNDVPDELSVGDNTDNSNSTNGGDDVLIGDVGGLNLHIQPATNYNVVLMLDASQSMQRDTDSGLTRLEIMQRSIKSLARQLAEHDGTVNLRVLTFNKDASPKRFLNFDSDDLADFNSFINNIETRNNTNFDAAFKDATNYLNNVSSKNFENISFLLTDGRPNTYTLANGDTVTPGNGQTSTEVTMQRTINSYNKLSAISDVHAIGVSEAAREDQLKFFDNTNATGRETLNTDDGGSVTGTVGQPQIALTVTELNVALQTGGNSTVEPEELGDDNLNGTTGDDVIFGDTVNSDDLTWTNGDTGNSFTSGQHNGLGYEGLTEYLKWAVNGGTAATDSQIIEYVKANFQDLRDLGRTDGGDDRLAGAGGNDILIGGGGDDTLIGGVGDDIMIGELGADTYIWNAANAGTTDDPDMDQVRGFREGKFGSELDADKLDLSNLLQDASEDTVLDYLHASGEDGRVVLSVKSDGGINADGSNADLTITLTGGTVDFNGSSESYINKLIDNGQLDIE